jgi:hypothetical protein
VEQAVAVNQDSHERHVRKLVPRRNNGNAN